MSEDEEVLTGSFQRYERLDLCILNCLKREPASFHAREDRRRLNKLSRLDPPLVSRERWRAWRALYTTTENGRRLLSDFGRNPHFEWADVPGVSGVVRTPCG